MCKISNEELVKLAQIGDVEARELLFENNKGLINKVANARYKSGHLIFDYDDIFQEACIGFNKAIDKFLKDFTEEQFKQICNIANNTSFLTGDNERGFSLIK